MLLIIPFLLAAASAFFPQDPPPAVTIAPDASLSKLRPGFYRRVDGVRAGNADHFGDTLFIAKRPTIAGRILYTGVSGFFGHGGAIFSEYRDGAVTHRWRLNDSPASPSGFLSFEPTGDGSGIALSRAGTIPGDASDRARFRYAGAKPEGTRTVFLAHRGLALVALRLKRSGLYPANTLPSFDEALDSGYQGYELDVRLTADREFIVAHDRRLDHVSTCRGDAREWTLAELRRCVVTKTPLVGERLGVPSRLPAAMPSLADALAAHLPREDVRRLIVDVKDPDDPGCVTAMERALRRVDPSLQVKLIVIVHNGGTLAALKARFPRLAMAREHASAAEEIANRRDGLIPEAAGRPRAGHDFISRNQGLLDLIPFADDRAFYGLARAHGYRVIAWNIAGAAGIRSFLNATSRNDDILLAEDSYETIARMLIKPPPARAPAPE